MSVYKHQKTPFYHYDFHVRGRRFSGSTGETSRREALKVEELRRDEAKEIAKQAAKAETEADPAAPMTINKAADRYWDEIGQHHKRSDQTDSALEWLVLALGPEKLVEEISDDDVARLVAKRRGEQVVNVAAERGRGRDQKQPAKARKARKPVKLVGPSRVNRSVTEPLRKVLRRARDIWGKKIQAINWKAHLLKESDERISVMREGDEEASIMAALPVKYHPIIYVKKRIGPRIAEMIAMEWTDIDWGELRIEIEGKGGSKLSVPMPSDVRDVLWALPRRHPKRVFTHEDGSPMTYSAVDSAWGRALAKAGKEDRDLHLHDLRHKAATDLLSETGNLRLVQKLLRHKDFRSTLRYAHADDGDLRRALEARATRPVPAAEPPIAENKEKKL